MDEYQLSRDRLYRVVPLHIHHLVPIAALARLGRFSI